MLEIANAPDAARSDAELGVFRKAVHVVASPRGIAFVYGQRAEAFEWDDIRSIDVRRRSVIVRAEAIRHAVVQTKAGTEVRRSAERFVFPFRLALDDVVEPSLSDVFARVLEEMRTRAFSVHGTAWHEYQNAMERIQGEFADQDDQVLPIAAAGLLLAFGLMGTILVAALVNAASARAVPPGAFAIGDRIGALDPRSIIAGFAFASLLAGWVLRLALGRHALVWARGVARGWHRTGSRATDVAVRQLGRTLLGTSSAAAILLLAFLTFWPNIAATTLVDPSGVRNEVLLPFVSVDESWRNVVELSRVDASSSLDRPGVRIRFADGREVATYRHELGGGSEGQLFELANRWWAANR
ncbi:MAG TPA: PH domain-containing protein [Candidatus Acidoferrales bacterium]|nr:PH domain-containing protein [Candidatus Acidoferrales bacterium]